LTPVSSTDDYIIDADYPIETYLKKNPAAGKAMSYARIFLNAQFHAKKMLTIKPASAIGKVVVCV